MKKILSVLLVCIISIAFNCPCFAAVLPANTPVLVQANSSVTSANLKSGDSVYFNVVNNVLNSGNVVIAQGTPVVGIVKRVTKKRWLGVPGYIEIGDFTTKSINDVTIPLNGAVNEKGKSNKTLSVALTILILPLFFIFTGKNAVINQGYQTTLFTTTNTNI